MNEIVRERVVITGMGTLNPLGLSVDALWDGLLEGRSGIGPMTLCDPTDFPCRIAGEVPGFDPHEFMEARDARRMARFAQLGIAASSMALQDARLNLGQEDLSRVGVLLGTGGTSFPDVEEQMRILVLKGGMRMSPFFMPMALPNMAAAQISQSFGLRGHSSTICTACAASTQAIGEATEVIRRGAASVMLAGGAEAGISVLGLGGFSVMRALSTHNEEPEQASRPFDANRDGFVPAEGASIVILESLTHAMLRHATVLAEIVGYSVTSDANHPVQPDRNGEGASNAISLALADANIEPKTIDYINAHGTSTPLNDAAETAAIKKAFGALAYQIPISSTKSMVGHSLGAAGALEAIACVRTITDRVMHPTINYENHDPLCDLDYIANKARPSNVQTVLSNSFGFGGQNACLILKRFEK